MHKPTLTASQQQCALEIREFLRDQDPQKLVVLKGLRGQGKSSIARQAAELLEWKHHEFASHSIKYETFGDAVAAEGPHLLAMEEGFQKEDLTEGIASARGRVSGVIVLARPFHSDAGEAATESGATILSKQAPGLQDDEIIQFARTLRPNLTDQELDVLREYSLGVPLLIQQIINSMERVTADEAAVICAQYLLKMDFSSNRLPREDIFEILNECVGGHVQRKIPDALRTSELFVAERSPLRDVNLSKVPHGFPRCPDTLGRYQRWVETAKEDRDTHFSLFVPRLTQKEFEALAEEYKLDHNHCFGYKGRVYMLAGSTRKTNVLMHEMSRAELTAGEKLPLAARDLHRYLKSNNAGECPAAENPWHSHDDRYVIELNDPNNFPFYVYSVDHAICHQLGIGLAIESDLQHRKLAYQVGLGGRTYDSYDPVKNTYSPFVREPLLKDQ